MPPSTGGAATTKSTSSDSIRGPRTWTSTERRAPTDTRSISGAERYRLPDQRVRHGHGREDVDLLTLNGTEERDDFLLRASEHSFPAGVAFVAALHGTPVAQVERINYNGNLEQLVLEAGGGGDFVTLDNNRAATTIRGGEGEDHFQVGQIFKSERDAANANIAEEDEFETVLTTRGHLSNGISRDTTIEGEMPATTNSSLFRNTAELALFGEDRRRQFHRSGRSRSRGPIRTELTGEGGADYVLYVDQHAPVHVNGGDGYRYATA